MTVASGLAAALCVAAIAGCSTTHSDRNAGPSDAAIRTDAARERRPVRLTLRPILDWQESEAGNGEPVPIDGVRVCVAYARPWGKDAWSDFVETSSPCTITVAKNDDIEDVVLDGAPGVSELILTAEKDGYMPSTFAVTTDRWDQDMRESTYPPALHMRRKEALWPSLPVQEIVSGDLGVVEVKVMVCRGLGPCAYASGATVAMDAPQSDGPYYSVGGRLDPNATKTSRGGESPQVSGGVSFANVAEGEYHVTVNLPGTICQVMGWFWGDPIWGFGSKSTGAIGVPVLAGHLTPNIAALCVCGLESSLRKDAGTCNTVPDASSL